MGLAFLHTHYINKQIINIGLDTCYAARELPQSILFSREYILSQTNVLIERHVAVFAV